MKFKIDSQNRLLNHMYQQDNIRIIDGMACNKKCIVICSSNGIYDPDTYEEFRSNIICNNYFEGGRLASFLIDYVERIILIRDVRKSYYVTGISKKYNSVDSVLELLKELTKGYEVVTAGGSSGGYMATIVGSYLKAKYVINAGGQWNLYKHADLEYYYFLRTNRNNEACNKYFDLSKRLQSNKVPVLYMYGGLNDSDIQQIKCAENVDNVYPIAIRSPYHAQSVSVEPYLRLLCATEKNIIDLYDINKDSLVDVDKLEKQINGSIELPKGFRGVGITYREQKNNAYTELLYQWIKKYQDSESYIQLTLFSGKVSIWGKGRYCDLLMGELKKQGVEVKCIVETSPLDKVYEGVPVVSIDDIPDDVDTIIVVPYYDMKNIKEKVEECCENVDVIGIDKYIFEGGGERNTLQS